MKINKIYSSNWEDYELIDAGNQLKLERWGKIITIRPEQQAYFKSVLSIAEWKKMATLEFIETKQLSGKWIKYQPFQEDNWTISYQNLTFLLQTTQFKHLGFFPEQLANWQLIQQYLKPEMKMLNLFAYTGVASIFGKSTGAAVTHIDSVKQVISWAKTNMELSGLNDIRWIQEDAFKFVQREIKRKHSYDLMIMDPPAWGIGIKNEKWKLETKIEALIENVAQILKKSGLFILNTYSPGITKEQLYSIARQFFRNIELSELWKKTNTGKELYYGLLLRAYK